MSVEIATDRIYLRDAERRAFEATAAVVEDGGRVALDATAFYVTGGGQPHDTGTLAWEGGSASVSEIRVVDIVGLDRQADGGTHVASTAEVGRFEVTKTESKGKANKRLRIALGDV